MDAKRTFTLTFGDQAENHVGMQKIGSPADTGFELEDLLAAQAWFRGRGVECEMIDIGEALDKHYEGSTCARAATKSAHVLVARKGLDALIAPDDSDDFFAEQDALKKDDKARMYGRVVSKKARHNLCFADEAQDPDYANGLGTLVAFESVPLLRRVRDSLADVIGPKAKSLAVEGNYYDDIASCGIGFHGDSERRRVVGVRVGATLPLHYQWFVNSAPVGERVEISLNHGDVYVMSEKAVGWDWKRKTIPTLRHAAGAAKYLTIKKARGKN